MKTLYKYSLKSSKEEVLIEIDTEGGHMVKASRSRQEAKTATGNLEDAFANIKPIIPVMSEVLKTFAVGSKIPEISFGIKITADGDALITSGQSDANFLVTIREQ